MAPVQNGNTFHIDLIDLLIYTSSRSASQNEVVVVVQIKATKVFILHHTSFDSNGVK